LLLKEARPIVNANPAKDIMKLKVNDTLKLIKNKVRDNTDMEI
jgi:hypothetical protein